MGDARIKKAAPTMNIAIKSNTLESTKPKNASFGVKTPVKVKQTATVIAVMDNGIFSHTNMIMAKTKRTRVTITPSILVSSHTLLRIGDTVNAFVTFIIRICHKSAIQITL